MAQLHAVRLRRRHVRAAQELRLPSDGQTYNIGRGFSALAPFVVGAVAKEYSFYAAFLFLAAASFLAAMLALALPETKGKALE